MYNVIAFIHHSLYAVWRPQGRISFTSKVEISWDCFLCVNFYLFIFLLRCIIYQFWEIFTLFFFLRLFRYLPVGWCTKKTLFVQFRIIFFLLRFCCKVRIIRAGFKISVYFSTFPNVSFSAILNNLVHAIIFSFSTQSTYNMNNFHTFFKKNISSSLSIFTCCNMPLTHLLNICIQMFVF